MKKNNLLFKKLISSLTLFSLFLALSFLVAQPSSAQTESKLTESLEFVPQISIPGDSANFTKGEATKVGIFNAATGKMESNLLALYIIDIFNYALAAAGILATVVLMAAGVLWLTSGGDSSKIGKAKELIGGSVTGMLLLACSWIILNTINPNLTKLQSISTKVLEPINYEAMVCCSPASGETILKVIDLNGRKVFIDGKNKGQEAKCPGGSQQCATNNSCVEYGKNTATANGEFACAPNVFCCTCSWWNGPTYNTSCYYNVTTSCKDICREEESSILRGGIGWNTYSNETYGCSTMTGIGGLECVYKGK